MSTYGIVFSGGGALGSWEVGCYEAIKSRHAGDAPVVVSGASAGALNAVGVCAGMSAPELMRLWETIKREDVCEFRFSPRDLAGIATNTIKIGIVPALLEYLSGYNSLYATDKLKDKLREILQPHFNAFMNSRIYIAVSLTNLVNNKKEQFYKLPVGSGPTPELVAQDREAVWTRIASFEQLISALLGSTALPVLFPPQAHYFDGGVLLNQPISPALRLFGPDILYVVIPGAEQLGKIQNIVDIGNTLLTAWLSMSLVSQLKIIKVINTMREYREETPIKICVIRPEEDLTTRFGVNLLSFGKKVRDLVAAGRLTTYERLNRFREDDPETWF